MISRDTRRRPATPPARAGSDNEMARTFFAILYVLIVLGVGVAAAAAVFVLLAVAGAKQPWLAELGLDHQVALALSIVFGSVPAVWSLNKLLTRLRYPLPGFQAHRAGFPVSDQGAGHPVKNLP